MPQLYRRPIGLRPSIFGSWTEDLEVSEGRIPRLPPLVRLTRMGTRAGVKVVEKPQPRTERKPIRRVLPMALTEPEYLDHAHLQFSDKYEKKTLVNFGTYARVFKCTRKKDGKEFALKEADVFGPYQEQLLHSCQVLLRLSHPNLTRVVDYVHDPVEERVYLISELYPCGDVYIKLKAERDNFIDHFPDERVVWDIISQIIDALAYLHAPDKDGIHTVIHRDISTRNILVTDMDSKKVILIASVLCTELVPGTKTAQLAGTLQYAAPEMLMGQEYDEKVDLWSLGCTIYEICKGYKLFFQADIPSLLRAQRATLNADLVMYSIELRQFVNALLTFDPKERLSAELAARHPKVIEARERLESGESLTYGWFQHLKPSFSLEDLEYL
ncbi:Kinase, NEK [Giardia muris]|uniref:non-specific serine/threonine protein kinase n=1 Tax=Giardia muris TaxID=5742 RepID=A0A4Z1SY60_GIAMU|nr:Kinase, NEK [Giardia muris]|eukprot:TNJ28448.1 Kinase, NEK [Giardia muris]